MNGMANGQIEMNSMSVLTSSFVGGPDCTHQGRNERFVEIKA